MARSPLANTPVSGLHGRPGPSKAASAGCGSSSHRRVTMAESIEDPICRHRRLVLVLGVGLRPQSDGVGVVRDHRPGRERLAGVRHRRGRIPLRRPRRAARSRARLIRHRGPSARRAARLTRQRTQPCAAAMNARPYASTVPERSRSAPSHSVPVQLAPSPTVTTRASKSAASAASTLPLPSRSSGPQPMAAHEQSSSCGAVVQRTTDWIRSKLPTPT